MKAVLLLLLVIPLFGMTSCLMTKRKEHTAYTKYATASISRVKLFTDSVIVGGNSGKKVLGISPTLFWAQFDATKRSSIVAVLPDPKNQNSVSVKVLAENTPDAAIESISKITAKMRHKDLTAEVAGDFARSIAQIKRTATVENFRTISYRMAELVNSQGQVNQDVKVLFEALIDASVKTSKMDAELANKELDLDIKKAEQRIFKEKNKATVLKDLRDQLEQATEKEEKAKIRELMILVLNGDMME